MCMSELFSWEHVLKEIVLSTHPPSWMARTTCSNSRSHSIGLGACWSVRRKMCYSCNATPSQVSYFGCRNQTAGNEGRHARDFFLCYFYSHVHLSSNFLPSTERRGLVRRWVTVSKNACMCLSFFVSFLPRTEASLPTTPTAATTRM